MVTSTQLHALMHASFNDARAEADFFRALLEATVYAHVPKDAPPDGCLQFIQFMRQDNGELVVPFFTDRATAEAAGQGAVGILALPGRDFLTLTRGATLLLNPTDKWLTLYPAEVDAILAGKALVRLKREKVEPMQQFVAVSPEGPIDALIKLLAPNFAAVDAVRAAYLAEVHSDKGRADASWLIEIIAPARLGERLAQTSAELLRPMLHELPPLMIVCRDWNDAAFLDQDIAIQIYARPLDKILVETTKVLLTATPRRRRAETKVKNLDPDQLERIVRQEHGFVSFDELDRAELFAPGFGATFRDWGRGLTVMDEGVPSRDWEAFLEWLRRKQRGTT